MLDRFTLHQPNSVTAASQMLAHFGEEAAVYAGGTELLVVLKERLTHYPHLIDIKRIPGLREITFDTASRHLRIGALATHREIERSPLVHERLPALASLASQVANVRVRAAGTIGGSLCFAEPHSDPATLLAALDASLTLSSATGSREVAVADFFIGVMETVRRHDELLTSVSIPLPDGMTGIAYERFKLHERPTAAVAARIRVDRGVIVDSTLVAGCVGERPQVLTSTNAGLIGRLANAEAASSAALIVRDEVETTSNPFESEEYIRQLIRTIARRAVTTAIHRATDREGGCHAA